MTIKDAEKLTGLTAKSIRLYESKGLITVDRNEENDYRNYTEENINQLKRIKVCRYFDFSIEEIKELLNSNSEDMADKIQKRMEKYEDETEDISSKRDLLNGISKDLSKENLELEDYADAIDFLEGEEMTELRELIDEVSIPSLSTTIIQTLVFCGPIGGLFLNIALEINKFLILNAVLALASTVVITLIWINFFKKRKQFKTKVKRKNKKHSPMWIWGIIALVSVFASFIGGNILICDKILAPDKWLFYETHQIAITIYIIVVMGIAGWGFLLAKQVIDNFKEIENYRPNIKCCFAWGTTLVVMWCITTYLCLMNTVYVTEDSIIVHSPFNIKGTTYSYEDVEKVETGFGDGGLAIFDYQKKGSFYYKVKVDGKTLLFTGGETSEDIQRYSDSYLELEEFDQKLMNAGAEKESSEENYDSCFMDQEYIDRFLRIINNK